MKVKKILILGSQDKFSIEKMYERAFKSLKCEVKFLHVYNIRKNFLHKITWKYFRFLYFLSIRKKIKRYLEKNKNFDLIIIFKGLYLKKTFLKEIKENSKNSKFINIFTDDPFKVDYFKDISNKNILRSIPEFDHVYIFSKKILKKLRLRFTKTTFSYLPFAHDKEIHKKKIDMKKKNYDLSFIGTADETRYRVINELKDFKIIIAGNGWNKFNLPKNVTYVFSADSKKYSAIINESMICLNLLRSQNNDSHNMKTFEIPSMGGLMLTKENKDQISFFPENIACVTYKNVEDIRLKINKIKNNPKKYEKIKKEGYKIALKNSYQERAKNIITTLYG